MIQRNVSFFIIPAEALRREGMKRKNDTKCKSLNTYKLDFCIWCIIYDSLSGFAPLRGFLTNYYLDNSIENDIIIRT